MGKPDAPVYGLALLLGIAAGLVEIALGDVLVTTLFVLSSTMALGFIRPKRAWRWLLVVGACVPLVELSAWLFLSWRPYRAQVWESGLGFVTGIAGCYGGAFARQGVDELVRRGE
jgi:hypothetical protein